MRDSGLLCLLGNEIFFLWEAIQNAINPYFFPTKYILYLQVSCGKINNNNNKDRSDEKLHFCRINVCRRGLLARCGGSGRQQGASACGDAPRPEVTCTPKVHGSCPVPGGQQKLSTQEQDVPSSLQLTHGMKAHAIAKEEDRATRQPLASSCSEKQLYAIPCSAIYTARILGSSVLSGVVKLIFFKHSFVPVIPEQPEPWWDISRMLFVVKHHQLSHLQNPNIFASGLQENRCTQVTLRTEMTHGALSLVLACEKERRQLEPQSLVWARRAGNWDIFCL